MAMIKPLNTISIYNYAEEASSQSLTNTVMAYSLFKSGTIQVTYDMIEDIMHDITSRTSPFFSKHTIDNLIKNETLQLVYNDKLKLTNAIPFFKKQSNNKTSVIINITNFSSMSKNGTISMSPNTLYAILLSGAFSLILDNSISSYMKDIYIMYSRLFSNVVSNLSYMDSFKKEKIQYLASNFIYYSVYGDTASFTNTYKDNLKYNSKDTIVSLENKLSTQPEHSAYENLQIFIENLNKIFPEMKKLTFKNFVDRWTLSYGSSTLFASEYVPYLFYMIISTACMSSAINIGKISIEISSNLTNVYKRIEQGVQRAL